MPVRHQFLSRRLLVRAGLTLALASAAGAGSSAFADTQHRTTYVLLSAAPDTVTVSHDSTMPEIDRARRLVRNGAPLLVIREDDSAYVIRDPGLLRKAFAIHEPQRELGEEQAELGLKQHALGERQQALGVRIREAAQELERGTRAGTTLQAELAALGTEQAEFGQSQAKLGERQRQLSTRQVQLAAEARERMRSLLREAVSRHLAEPLK